MAQGIPSWMNAEFVQGVLRRIEQDDTIEVIDMYSKQGTEQGDNYSSDMYRIIVDFLRKRGNQTITDNKSVFVKLAPTEEGHRKDVIEESGMFDIEIHMMTDTLKKMNDIVGNNHRFNASLYHVKQEWPCVLIIEDLAPQGFRMANRHSGLDVEHCLLVMKNLAKFHASSAVLCEREPSLKTLYTKGIFREDSPGQFGQYFINSTKTLADEMEHWPELGPRYAQKLRNIAENIYDKGVATVEPRDDQFNVINHGDCWVNNMLFRYDDEGKVVDHIFVDFQLPVYSSPAIDLHYFLSSSSSQKVYDESKQFLLEEYLRTLTSCLKEFGYTGTIPTMDMLQKYLQERAFYSVITSLTVLPVILLEKEKATTYDGLLEKNPGYANPAYRKVIVKRMPHFDKLGLLDA